MGQVLLMLEQVVTDMTVTDFSIYGFSIIAFFTVPLMMFEYWTERSGNMLVLQKASKPLQVIIYIYLLLMMIVFPPLISQEFIYFQF
jgi:hypothetical protein